MYNIALLVVGLAGIPVLLFLLYTLYILHVHNHFSHLPSPKLPSFYLGHIPDVVRLRKESGNPGLSLMKLCEYWMNQSGSTSFVVYFFHNARVFTADPDVVKAVVTNVKNGKSKPFYRIFKSLYGERLLGNGLVMIPDYETWKIKRSVYDPAFTKAFLKNLVPKFNVVVNETLEKLRLLADGETVVPLGDHVRSFVINIVSKTIFGYDIVKMCEKHSSKIDIPPGFPDAFNYIVFKVSSGCDEAMMSLSPSLMKFFYPFEAEGCRAAIRAMRDVGRECIQLRMKAIQNGEDTEKDVLSQILQTASIKGTEGIEELIDDFCNFFGAGSESTSLMLQFAIVLILEHPEVLTRLVEEVNEVLGDKTEVSAEDVEKLVYTEKVLNESLRMYSVAPAMIKELHSDLRSGDMVFPANTTILLMSGLMNTMSEYYDNPEVFNPDRFNPATKPSSFVFFPFGVGHRACIGKYFAMIEAKIFLARLFQQYHITLPKDFKLVPVQRVMLQPKETITCTLTPVTS